MVGAASPLWGFFAGAAASGVAFWWMTHWSRPANLEALFGRSMSVVSPELAPALPPSSDPEAVDEPVVAVAVKAMEPFIAAVEAAEEPLLETSLDGRTETEVSVAPLVENMAPAPAIEATPEPMSEPLSAPLEGTAPGIDAPRARRRSGPTPEPAEPTVE
jgi:hypothetical protein